MRTILFFGLLCCLLSCKKDNNNNPAIITGKWVLEPGTSGINDTLIFYTQGDKMMFFDKSIYFQLNMAAWLNDDAFKYEYQKIEGDYIKTRSLSLGNSDTWFTVYFKLLSNDELKIGDFRGTSSSTNTVYQYRKVN